MQCKMYTIYNPQDWVAWLLNKRRDTIANYVLANIYTSIKRRKKIEEARGFDAGWNITSTENCNAAVKYR